jgi:non-specific serine/threonine protein kinase
LQVAAEVPEAFPDGAFFVNLAPINDPALVLPTIAQPLEITESGGRPLREVLHAFLRAKQLLLMLDNCEQVVDAAPAVVDLLKRFRKRIRRGVTRLQPCGRDRCP